MTALMLGVLAMHGLASADGATTHHATPVPGVTEVDEGSHHDPHSSDSDSMEHVGAVCLWLAATGAIALGTRARRSRVLPLLPRFDRRVRPVFVGEPAIRSRSPGLVAGVDQLLC